MDNPGVPSTFLYCILAGFSGIMCLGQPLIQSHYRTQNGGWGESVTNKVGNRHLLLLSLGHYRSPLWLVSSFIMVGVILCMLCSYYP